MTTLRIGDPVQIDETTEVLTLVCIDQDAAWCRDGAGNHITHKLVDLVPVPPRPRLTLAQMRGVFEGVERGQKWQR